MPERRSSLAERVSLFVLLVALLSPLIALVVLMITSPPLADEVTKTLGAPVVVSVIGAIMVARRLFFPGWNPPPGSSEGGDGGGGSGPPGPIAPPDAPRGGIPLPDAEPAAVRLRDHDRADRRQVRPRRPAREPNRSPAPAVPHR